VITSEELRVEALSASAKRGKWVARRRIFRRWVGWFLWRYVLPTFGLITVVVTLSGLAFWQYLGHDVAYVVAQKWVQQEFGSFQTGMKSTNLINNLNNPKQGRPGNTSMIPTTDEAKPDLQIDHHLTIKTTP
jgi:hypothetical protein